MPLSAASPRGLVCLDYDGVLVDSAEHLLELAAEAHVGVGSGRAATREDLALIETLTFEQLARRCGVASDHYRAYAERMFALQRADRYVPALFEGIEAMLAKLAASHNLVIVTASIEANVLRVLDAHGLRSHVALVLDGAGHGDKAAHIGTARERFGVPATRTWMVGDAISDIHAARAAGVTGIAVGWGYQPAERLVAAGADHVAGDPARVLELTGSAD